MSGMACGVRRGRGAGLVGVVWAVLVLIVAGSSVRAAQPPPASAQPMPPAKGASVQLPVLHVAVTIPPLKGLVEPLLPPGSDVKVLVRPGMTEHGFEFTPSDLAELSKADIVVYVGLNLEARIEKAVKARQGRGVVCMAEALGIAASEQGGDADHDEKGRDEPGGHDAHADHHHDDSPVDQHLWLDPGLVKRFIPALQAAVVGALKEKHAPSVGEDDCAQAAEALEMRIDELDRECAAKLGALKGRSFITMHNAFSRLAARYGLIVARALRPIEQAEPTPSDFADAVKSVRDQGVRAVFMEPQFNPAPGERLAKAAGIRLGTLDPLGTGDWFAMMRGNVDSLVKGLSD